MEKVMMVLRDTADDADAVDDTRFDRLRELVARTVAEGRIDGATVAVRDAAVRDSIMTLTTLDPPALAVVSVWTHQSYGDAVSELVATLDTEWTHVHGYVVTESVPVPPPVVEYGKRTPGFTNIAMLRCPPGLDRETWLRRWQLDHTAVAIDTQATFGYVQNAVVRTLTDDAPIVDAFVEEVFPMEGLTSLHAFFGAKDDTDLNDRLSRMLASTAAFGANENIDTVPTSRYVIRSPFVS